MMKLDVPESDRSSNAGKEEVGGVEILAFQEVELKGLFVSSIFPDHYEELNFFPYTYINLL